MRKIILPLHRPSVWIADDEFTEKYGGLGLVVLTRLLEDECSRSLCIKYDDDCYAGAVANEREAFARLRELGWKYLGRLETKSVSESDTSEGSNGR